MDALLLEQIKVECRTMQEELDFHYLNYKKSCDALNNKLDRLIADLQECHEEEMVVSNG